MNFYVPEQYEQTVFKRLECLKEYKAFSFFPSYIQYFLRAW